MKLRIFTLAAAVLLAACSGDPSLPTGAAALEAARLNLQMGVDYARKGEYALAVEKLQRSIKEDATVAEAHSTLAFVYAQMGQAGLAEEQYRKALVLGPDDANVRNNFGVFLCANGKPAEAQRYFVEAANNKNYPTPAAAWTNAGVCARRHSDLDAAERYFREALQVNPKFPEALAQMAWLTNQQKDYLRSRAFLQRYTDVAQPTPETLMLGVMNERQLGDADAAQNYASRLLRDFPDSEQASNLKSPSP